MTVETKEPINIFTVPTASHAQSHRTVQTNSFWHIDKDMLRFKLHYFLFIGAVGTVIPYITLFAKDYLGIAASSLGAILTVQMFFFVFTKPFFGYLADYFNKLKLVISSLTVVFVASYFLLLLVPSAEIRSERGELMYCPLNTTDISSFCGTFSNTHDQVIVLLEENNIKNVTIDCQQSLLNYSVVFSCYRSLSDRNIATNLTSEFITESCSIYLNNSLNGLDFLTSQVSVSWENLTAICKIPSRNLTDNLVTATSSSDFMTLRFWLFAVLFTISSIACNAIFTLSDTALYETLEKTGSEFGKQRLWGGIGWGIMAPIAGYINDYTDGYLASWILMAAMMVLVLLNISKMDLVKPHFSKNILKDVSLVLRSRKFLVYEVVIWINGMGATLIWFYLTWFLSSIGGSKFLCGLCLFIQSFGGSLPCMFYADWIKKKLGHFNLLVLALSGYIVRFLWYSQLQNPWYVLPVELLHGITYGLYYPVLASFAKTSAKPGAEATTQAIVFSTHEGLGGGIGCIIAGICFDYIGGHRTFFFAGMFAICGVAISLFLSFFIKNQSGKVKFAHELT